MSDRDKLLKLEKADLIKFCESNSINSGDCKIDFVNAILYKGYTYADVIGKYKASAYTSAYETKDEIYGKVYAKANASSNGIPSAGASAGVQCMKAKDEYGNYVSIGTASVKVSASATYFGAGAQASAVSGKAGPLKGNLGIGISTGVGFKDESVTAEIGGCGVTVGRKIGISVLGSKFAVDLGWFWSADGDDDDDDDDDDD